MSDQATGGDGSVRWTVRADAVDPATVINEHPNGPNVGSHHQEGVAMDGDVDDWFTISLKVPREIGNTASYLQQVRAGDQNALWGIKADPNDAGRVYLNLRIEGRTPDQIRVSWGNSPWVVRQGGAAGRTPGNRGRALTIPRREAVKRGASARTRKRSAAKKRR